MYADVFGVLKIYVWGARSLRSLAQYKSMIFFLSVHLGVLPPQYQKAGYATGRTILSIVNVELETLHLIVFVVIIIV